MKKHFDSINLNQLLILIGSVFISFSIFLLTKDTFSDFTNTIIALCLFLVSLFFFKKEDLFFLLSFNSLLFGTLVSFNDGVLMKIFLIFGVALLIFIEMQRVSSSWLNMFSIASLTALLTYCSITSLDFYKYYDYYSKDVNFPIGYSIVILSLLLTYCFFTWFNKYRIPHGIVLISASISLYMIADFDNFFWVLPLFIYSIFVFVFYFLKNDKFSLSFFVLMPCLYIATNFLGEGISVAQPIFLAVILIPFAAFSVLTAHTLPRRLSFDIPIIFLIYVFLDSFQFADTGYLTFTFFTIIYLAVIHTTNVKNTTFENKWLSLFIISISLKIIYIDLDSFGVSTKTKAVLSLLIGAIIIFIIIFKNNKKENQDSKNTEEKEDIKEKNETI